MPPKAGPNKKAVAKAADKIVEDKVSIHATSWSGVQ